MTDIQRDRIYIERFVGRVGLDWEGGWPVITLTAAGDDANHAGDDPRSILDTMTFTFTNDGAGGVDTHINQTYRP